MNEILFEYKQVEATTWAYLSAFLMIALYFKFARMWSLRNLDLFVLILFAPGLLLTTQGTGNLEHIGYIWLFVCGLLYMIRLLIDPLMVRRPLLEPNLLVGGLTFLGVTLYLFLMANVATQPLDAKPSAGSAPAPREIVERESPVSLEEEDFLGPRPSPYYPLMGWLLHPPEAPQRITPQDETNNSEAEGPVPTLEAEPVPEVEPAPAVELEPDSEADSESETESEDDTETENESVANLESTGAEANETDVEENTVEEAPESETPPSDADASASEPESKPTSDEDRTQIILRALVIAAQFMVVLGMTLVGYRHFDNVKSGIAASVLYLLLPYTAIFTERFDHALPAALLTWAIVFYRRPIVAGILIGLAGGLSYFPLCLLPLWISFYWRRGLFRFLSGVAPVLCLLIGLLVFCSPEGEPIWSQIRQMFGLWMPRLDDEMGGFWHSAAGVLPPIYRLPVVASFAVLCGSLAIWPSQKNLGTLLSCSAAVMLATQFWHPYGGGLYMAWYLPLLLLTIFRPNLEDRIAETMLSRGLFARKREKRPPKEDSKAK